MAYAGMSALGECRAKWADNVSKVVIDIDYPNVSMHLTTTEAHGLIADLTAALADAETTDSAERAAPAA